MFSFQRCEIGVLNIQASSVRRHFFRSAVKISKTLISQHTSRESGHSLTHSLTHSLLQRDDISGSCLKAVPTKNNINNNNYNTPTEIGQQCLSFIQMQCKNSFILRTCTKYLSTKKSKLCKF